MVQRTHWPLATSTADTLISVPPNVILACISRVRGTGEDDGDLGGRSSRSSLSVPQRVTPASVTNCRSGDSEL